MQRIQDLVRRLINASVQIIIQGRDRAAMAMAMAMAAHFASTETQRINAVGDERGSNGSYGEDHNDDQGSDEEEGKSDDEEEGNSDDDDGDDGEEEEEEQDVGDDEDGDDGEEEEEEEEGENNEEEENNDDGEDVEEEEEEAVAEQVADHIPSNDAESSYYTTAFATSGYSTQVSSQGCSRVFIIKGRLLFSLQLIAHGLID